MTPTKETTVDSILSPAVRKLAQTYSVEFCYPSSPGAREAGWEKQGAWVVEKLVRGYSDCGTKYVGGNAVSFQAVGYFETKESALEFCSRLNNSRLISH